MKRKVHIICIFLFIIALLACEENNTDKIKVFIQNYIETVSIEHEKHKTNVTDKMTAYFYDYENKENADMPEFLEIGPFRNNVLIINNYTIISIKEINDVKIPGCKYIYDVNVQFEIETENGITKQKIANYWVTYYKNKFYIYGDNFLQDIYILKKDLDR